MEEDVSRENVVMPHKRARLSTAEEEIDSSACDSPPTTEADGDGDGEGRDELDDSPSSASPGGSSSTSALSPPPLLSPASKAMFEARDATKDLPPALIEAGWRRCFSAREQSYYFFNKVSRQSCWTMPELSSDDNRGNGMKRQSIDDASQPSARRFVDSTDWELSIVSNAKMRERLPIAAYPSQPDIEALRDEAVRKLRHHFHELCHNREGIDDTPPEALSRWLVERAWLGGASVDSLLPSASDVVLHGLLRELLNCVPVRLQKIHSASEARRQLSRYADGARRLADSSRTMSAEQRKQIKWQCREMIDWLGQTDKSADASIDEYLSRLKFLRARCQSALTEAARQPLEQICTKLSSLAGELGQGVYEQHQRLMRKSGIDISEVPLPPPRVDKLVPCYPTQLRFASPRQPSVSMVQSHDGAWIDLTRGVEKIRINSAHFFKLEQLYRINCFDDRQFNLFLPRVWSTVKRYQTLTGFAPHEGVSLFRSPLVSVFRCCARLLQTTFEAYATPFTSYFRQFCSPFPDTDGYFGSRGRFTDFRPVEGSFVLASPPFCEEMAEANIEHMLSLLSAADSGPLSFVVLLANVQSTHDQTQSPCDRLTAILRDSGFCPSTRSATLPPYDHYWRHGAVQCVAKDDPGIYVRSPSATHVFIAQNTAGETRWPNGDAAVAAICEAFRTFPSSSRPTLAQPGRVHSNRSLSSV